MKKLLLGVTAVLFASLTGFAAEKWVEFEDRIYLDNKAIKKINDNSYFLRIKVLSTPSEASDAAHLGYTIIEETIDCKNEMITPESIALYDNKGKLIVKRTKEQIAQPPQKIQPDFIEARIQQKICKVEFDKQ